METSKLKQLKVEHEQARDRLTSVQAEMDRELSKSRVKCTSNVHGKGCGLAFAIGRLEYIQTHWYVQPHGCTGGDYWLPGEGNFICPHCGHLNRLYDRPEIEKLKHRFASVKDTF